MALLIVVTFLLLIIYIILLAYYFIGWNSIRSYTCHRESSPGSTPVSVLVPARNEALNLPVLLQSLLAQNYPAHLFEVIVIDDFSTDSTAQIVSAYSTTNIKLLSLQDYTESAQINSYKKKAIETGIQESKGTLIVTTDADCYLPQNWLKTIVGFYEEYHPVFIAAPVSINNSISFIEIFQALDFMALQGITGASVYKSFHSMCNGANMAYEKKVFYEVGGFKGIDQIASGDDMLLMHKIFKRYPKRVLFLKSAGAIAETQPVKNIREFFSQRIRWASKANKYDDKRILPVLAAVYFFNLLMFVIPVLTIFWNPSLKFFNYQTSIFLCWQWLLLLKIFTELTFLFPVAKFFQKMTLLFLFPFMQPFHIIYTIIAGWLGRFVSYKWKGRKVK